MIYAIAVKFMKWVLWSYAPRMARRCELWLDLRKAPHKTSVLKQNIKIILNLWNLHPEDARNFISMSLGVSFKIFHRILSPILKLPTWSNYANNLTAAVYGTNARRFS